MPYQLRRQGLALPFVDNMNKSYDAVDIIWHL